MVSRLTVVGLKRQILIVEGILKTKKRLGKDYSYEVDLLNSWKAYLPGGRNHHKLAHNATKSKSTPL